MTKPSYDVDFGTKESELRRDFLVWITGLLVAVTVIGVLAKWLVTGQIPFA